MFDKVLNTSLKVSKTTKKTSKKMLSTGTKEKGAVIGAAMQVVL